MRTGAYDDNHRISPLKNLVHDWHRDEHDEHKGSRLISLEVAVNLSSPIEFELGVKVQIRLLISLKSVKCHRHHHYDDISSEVVVSTLAQRRHRLREMLLIKEVRKPFGAWKLGERLLFCCGLPLK